MTSDAGLLSVRELDEAILPTEEAGDLLTDCGTGKNTKHELSGLLRQSICAHLTGYEGVNDQEKPGRDPAVRAVIGNHFMSDDRI